MCGSALRAPSSSGQVLTAAQSPARDIWLPVPDPPALFERPHFLFGKFYFVLNRKYIQPYGCGYDVDYLYVSVCLILQNAIILLCIHGDRIQPRETSE